jgi:hypothetical protein
MKHASVALRRDAVQELSEPDTIVIWDTIDSNKFRMFDMGQAQQIRIPADGIYSGHAAVRADAGYSLLRGRWTINDQSLVYVQSSVGFASVENYVILIESSWLRFLQGGDVLDFLVTPEGNADIRAVCVVARIA